jgi:hypothetical protein
LPYLSTIILNHPIKKNQMHAYEMSYRVIININYCPVAVAVGGVVKCIPSVIP